MKLETISIEDLNKVLRGASMLPQMGPQMPRSGIDAARSFDARIAKYGDGGGGKTSPTESPSDRKQRENI